MRSCGCGSWRRCGCGWCRWRRLCVGGWIVLLIGVRNGVRCVLSVIVCVRRCVSCVSVWMCLLRSWWVYGVSVKRCRVSVRYGVVSWCG